MAIKGKVAAILNERDLVINKGLDQGVREGMKFVVIEEEVPVVDPDTEEILVRLSREKIRVRIVEVGSKYAIGKTYEIYKVRVAGAASRSLGIPTMSLSEHEVSRVRTLRSDNTISFVPLDATESFVKVGDVAVELEEDL